ncbi:MAG: imidazolonepropionase, partial [Gemmatimonadaceae bacterium]|nr:imidazolonepropionase [Gemmatimonadaceae bacterium]
MSRLLFVNAAQVVTCAGPGRARRGAEMRDAGVLTAVAVAVNEGQIAAVGPPDELERSHAGADVIDCEGRVLSPGLVDSHTHAIFGRARYEEQELRASGVGYMEIARRGGGIHSSVADLRARTEDELFDLALPRILRLASYGSTTIEVKSGYGLSLDDELKSLRVVARLAREVPVRLVPTWLGAHEIPQEFSGSDTRRRDYVRLLMDEMLPAVAREGLARFADVFCEPGVFTLSETRDILSASRAAGLGIKLHADELEPHGGAELAADLGAVSADHLGAVSEQGIAALAASGTVATLLPGTMLFLGRQRQAPARALIAAGAAVALATDFNPGTSPTFNFPLILTLGVSQLRMTVAEVFLAATVNG